MSKMLNEIIDTMVLEELLTGLSKITIYFDMDGVLADFGAGVSVNPQAKAANDLARSLLKDFPELVNLTDDEIKNRLKGVQTEPRMKALKKAWNDARQKKFMMTGNPGFFLNLPVLPGAREMLVHAAEVTGKKPAILTAPVDNNPQRCAEEKLAWLQKHFAGLFDGFHCTQDKAAFASPNSILIDDRTKYTVPFEANGGISILHKDPADSMKKLDEILASLAPGA